jgi:hypothetical protein
MTIADLIKSTIDSSKERMKSPIVGSYICSFLIFNWKPLVIILFSNEKIENRISAVELYFNPWYWSVISVVIPIVISLVYTFGAPMLMVWVEAKLEPTKEKRIKRIYKSKQFVVTEKITLAGKELELKDAESGNKEKQELLDRISYLEESISQLQAGHKSTIENLNTSLKESNEIVRDLTAKISRIENGTSSGSVAIKELVDGQYRNTTLAGVLRETSIDEDGLITAIGSNERARFLLINGMVDETPKGYILTEKGEKLRKQVQ